ncbi:ATP-binding protein [Streptomyces rubiginosohelvolus]|uniref:ATP-binding protein n=1 Tax=Streptomyces rubiginosohelvolus TaxID=67362 RepID=UPI003790BE34
MNQVPPTASELTLAATPNAVAWARRHTVGILQRWRFPAEGIEIARLLVSELATNAIQHARPPMSSTAPHTPNAAIGTIVLKPWPTAHGVLVAVSDRDPRPPRPERATAAPPEAGDCHSQPLGLLPRAPPCQERPSGPRFQRSPRKGSPAPLAVAAPSPRGWWGRYLPYVSCDCET